MINAITVLPITPNIPEVIIIAVELVIILMIGVAPSMASWASS